MPLLLLFMPPLFTMLPLFTMMNWGSMNRGDMVNRGSMVNRGGMNNRSSGIASISSISNAMVSTVSQTISSISGISQTISSHIGVSLSLGHMDSASRVSHIAAGSSIGSGSHYSRDSGRGGSSDGQGGRGRHLGVSSMVVDMVSRAFTSMAISSIASISSIAQAIVSGIAEAISTISSIANMSPISSISQDIRVSLSCHSHCQTEHSQELDHVEVIEFEQGRERTTTH